MVPCDPCIMAKLYFPAMPEPITVRLTDRQIGNLDLQTQRYLLPDRTVIYGHPEYRACCVVHAADLPSVQGAILIGQLKAINTEGTGLPTEV